ncbi:uncharacterized protein ARMOST_00031 [Armillaria ostoyae]|uniref:Uncharacterized protein n=1 Tax=Armillaria ostoyae TaxID=47428 RepID=A0A284QJZ6_ARMOS|nr:uncharacterized protein ARMOST_00031 [Armillaria ostoyae]
MQSKLNANLELHRCHPVRPKSEHWLFCLADFVSVTTTTDEREPARQQELASLGCLCDRPPSKHSRLGNLRQLVVVA